MNDTAKCPICDEEFRRDDADALVIDNGTWTILRCPTCLARECEAEAARAYPEPADIYPDNPEYATAR